jgi:hypothetical protein
LTDLLITQTSKTGENKGDSMTGMLITPSKNNDRNDRRRNKNHINRQTEINPYLIDKRKPINEGKNRPLNDKKQILKNKKSEMVVHHFKNSCSADGGAKKYSPQSGKFCLPKGKKKPPKTKRCISTEKNKNPFRRRRNNRRKMRQIDV